ncbi:hypothetical protein HDU86_008132 [Geranomyces michiganensis]|nr:hypothetical protein HDU86_008132 [Geranomyces michiganensis]
MTDVKPHLAALERVPLEYHRPPTPPHSEPHSPLATATMSPPSVLNSQLTASLARSELSASLSRTVSSLRTTAETVAHNASDIGRGAMAVLQLYMEQYPSLQTFVLTGTLLSAVPVSMFAIWVALTTLGSIFTAVIGVFVVEGGLIALGLTVLLPVECCIIGVAVAAAVARSTGVLGMGAVKQVASKTTHLINEANRQASIAHQRLGTELMNAAVKRKAAAAGKSATPPVIADDPED